MTGAAPSVIDAILARRSTAPRHLGLYGPGPEDLQSLASAAAAAPEHGRLGPLPLIHIPDGKRNAQADLFMEAARAADPNASAAVFEPAGARALSGPVFLEVIATIQNDHPDIAQYEQWISVGAALQNILLAAEALSFAAKMVSGRRVRSPVLRSAFRRAENDHLVGFVMFGTASAEAAASLLCATPWIKFFRIGYRRYFNSFCHITFTGAKLIIRLFLNNGNEHRNSRLFSFGP